MCNIAPLELTLEEGVAAVVGDPQGDADEGRRAHDVYDDDRDGLFHGVDLGPRDERRPLSPVDLRGLARTELQLAHRAVPYLAADAAVGYYEDDEGNDEN